MYRLIYVLCVIIQLPGMIASKDNWANFIAFGWCLAIFFVSLLDERRKKC